MTIIPANFSSEESNALIATLFTSSMDSLTYLSPDYKVRYANEPMARLIKIPLDQVLGLPIEDLIPGWSRQMNEVCQKTRLTGQLLTADFYPFSVADQPERENIYWKVTIGPVHGTEGAFLGWVLFLREVAKYKQKEVEKTILSQDLENTITILNGITENLPAGLAILDGATLTYKWVSREFVTFLNLSYPLDDLSELSFEESIFLEQKSDLLVKIREVARTRIPLHDIMLNRKQNYWNCNILPIFTRTADPDLMIVVYNITEKISSRKLIEEYACKANQHFHQLELEQARLQAVLEQMPCGVIMFDARSNKTVLTNRKYSEIWQVSAAGKEIGEQNWPGEFFHPDGRPYLQTELPIVRTVRWGETVANEEIVCRRRDDSWMVVICNSAPVLDREGKIVAGVVVFSDITELKEATTKAALTNQLQQIIEFLPDGTFVVDQNRKVIAWNRALELLTGISKGDIIGTGSYKDVGGGGNLETLIDEIFEGIPISSDSGGDRSGEVAVQQILLPVLNQRENVLLDIKATPIRNEQGEITGVIETIRDITHQKQMEAEAIRMQKLDSLGILAGGIAHDFNNILAAILANLQLATMKLKRQEDIVKYLTETIEITRKASNLTHQLLTFAKGGAPVKKTTSILELIIDTVEFVLRGSNVKANFHFQENLWAVEIDEGQITQVINNVTINAVQAMPLGGFIEITFENIVLPVEGKYHPGRYVKLSIRDFGCGIPAKIFDKIFDPFFTTKKVGNGLGLSTSYSIIKRHNGYIEVESIEGSGAVFYIYLPASTAEVIFPEPSPEVAATGESKILLMDDDAVIRQAVRDMLVHYGYQVTIAKDGNEAIGFYRQAMSAGERFDVVIMDLTVPGGMGGLEAMAVLRRIDPPVKAIISSGYANNPVMSDYKQYGFCGFVAKPYKFDELIEVLNRALNR